MKLRQMGAKIEPGSYGSIGGCRGAFVSVGGSRGLLRALGALGDTGVRWADLKRVVDPGNLVPRKNLSSKKTFRKIHELLVKTTVVV